MANESSLWKKVLGTALKVPGVQVNRNEYLTQVLSNYCYTQEDIQKAIKTCPQMVVDKNTISKIADSVIGSHRKRVSALSFATGLPGGLTLAATIPADMTQYYFHTLVVAQKLAYLYGIPALYDKNGDLTDEAIDLMTVFVGVMSGVAAANQAMKKIAQAFAEQIVKRLPRFALTKSIIYQVVKQIAKWIGVRLTKDTFAKGVSKVVPVIGGIISGSVTYVVFKKEAARLKKRLQEDMDLYKNAYQKAEDGDNYTEYEEVTQ